MLFSWVSVYLVVWKQSFSPYFHIISQNFREINCFFATNELFWFHEIFFKRGILVLQQNLLKILFVKNSTLAKPGSKSKFHEFFILVGLSDEAIATAFSCKLWKKELKTVHNRIIFSTWRNHSFILCIWKNR